MIRRSLFKLVLALVVVFPLAGTGQAGRDDDLNRLFALLQIDETIEIMQIEGHRYGTELAQDMIPDVDAEKWEDTLDRIYDHDKMLRLILSQFGEELDDSDIAQMIGYLESTEGKEIVQLEISARRVFLDPDAETAAIAHFEKLEFENPPFVRQIETLISDSDLVEMNVMGTLNSSLMFYRGLNDGGAFSMTEAEMLADVWDQEEEARQDARVWLNAFLAMAYQPLNPEQIEGYAAFYRTSAGRQLNSAIFAAFDRLYEETSYLLGLAVAEHLTSEPL